MRRDRLLRNTGGDDISLTGALCDSQLITGLILIVLSDVSHIRSLTVTRQLV